MKLTEQKKEDILAKIKPNIDDANQYYKRHLEADYLERQNIIEASAGYYNTKYKNLSKIPLTTSEVYDTIMWIMPALVETFSNGDDIVRIQGQNAEDDKRADKVQKWITYQEDRLNDGFMSRYYWMLSALQNNVGFLKISWIQHSETEKKSDTFDDAGLMALQQNPNIVIKSDVVIAPGDGLSIPSIHAVEYEETTITENQPLIEVVPVTELSWASNTKKLKDAVFVKHRKRVTLDYLYQREREGVYFDIDKAKEASGKPRYDSVEQRQRDHVKEIEYGTDDLRREIEIDECFCQYDMGKGKLEDWVFTVADESVLIGAQENTMGRRHPFIDLVAMPDPWNVVPRKGLTELLAEIQHINTALIRLFVRHLVLANEGRRFVNKQVVDQDDLINEAMDVGVEGDPRQAVFPMPPTTMSPMTMSFFQLMQSKIESTVGITKYNTGTDAANLNPTATGVTALIDQANKKIKLIARIMAETGYTEKYRFLIALNQKYPSPHQFVRLLNEDIEIDPTDLEGKLDLIVNVAGLGSANRQAEIQNLQLILGVLQQVGQAFPGMVTPDKAYNVVKMLLEQMGRKNVDDFVNKVEIQQHIQQMLAQKEEKPDDNIRIPIDKMPWSAQAQALAKVGINVSLEDFIQEAQLKALLGGDTGGNTRATSSAPQPGNSAGRAGPAGKTVPAANQPGPSRGMLP